MPTIEIYMHQELLTVALAFAAFIAIKSIIEIIF